MPKIRRSCLEDNTQGLKDYLRRELKNYDYVVRVVKNRYGRLIKQRVVGFTSTKVRVVDEEQLKDLDDWLHRRKTRSFVMRDGTVHHYEPDGPSNVDCSNLIIYARGTKDSKDPLEDKEFRDDENSFIINLDLKDTR